MNSSKFVEPVSNKINWNEALSTVGNTLGEIFKKPDTYVNVTAAPIEEEEKDNTLLYVGIGGGVLLLVVLLIIMLK